ncbi:hypothetical protein ACS0TY_009879 [Phlomoides rotata]
MDSETSPSELSSFIESLINSRNRDASLFLPFFLGLNAATPLQETENQDGPRDPPPDRIILINPFTQEMVLIERSSSDSSNSPFTGFDSLFNDLFSSKGGRPPASKASIDALESVDVEGGENDGDQCVICLEEWEAGEKVKKMPCNHRFHGECIVKWLKIHGSCPVCRYEMPMDEPDGEKVRSGDGERRRDIWMSFAFGRDRRSGESDQNVPSGSSDSSASDQELQN